MDELVRQYFEATGVNREVVTDDESRYYGERLQKKTLLPSPGARVGNIKLKEWVERSSEVKA
jgi:hypothetical protein